MTCTIIPAGQETAEQYHRSGAFGSTLISHFLKSPRLANMIRTRAFMPATTAAMAFGTAFHALLDTAGNFAMQYRIGPNVDHRTKEWKAAVATAHKDGVTLLGTDDHADLLAMRESLLANPVAANLLDGAEHEVGFRMPSGYGPFQVQCRADILHRWNCLSDIKTSGDIDDFHRSVIEYGYHRQAALYRWIVHEACGEWLPFSFLVVDKTAPLYRCRVFDLTQDYLDLGWSEIEQALIEIGERSEKHDWNDYRDAESIDVPAWKVRQRLAVAA